MKIKLFAFLIAGLQLPLFAQRSVIHCKHEGSRFLTNIDKNKNYSAPLELIFPSDFKGKQIILTDSTKNKTLIKLVLGKDKDVPTYADQDEYRIVIDSNKIITGVSNPALQGVGISQNSFYVRSGNNYSELLRLSSITKSEKKHNEYIPGIILYDALYINKLLTTEPDRIRDILTDSYYNIDQSAYDKNQYLSNVIGKNYKINTHVQSLEFNAGSIVKSVGGLDVTSLADGFAKFIVKRTKQELSIAFFDKFRNELKKSDDLKSLFPSSWRALDLIGEKIYMYEAYIHLLRESFEKDLSLLPSNLPKLIENHEDVFKNFPELKAILLSGFYISQAIQDKQHPGEIIENYPADIHDSLNPNVKAGLQTLQLISVALKDKSDENRYWAPAEDMKQLYLPENEQVLKLFLGLLEQKTRQQKIAFKDDKGNSFFLDSIIDHSYGKTNAIPAYRNYFKTFGAKANALDIKIKMFHQGGKDSVLLENYYSTVNAFVDLMRYLTKVETLPDFPPLKIKLTETSARYFDLIQSSAEIVIDVNRRNYASAVVNTTYIIETMKTDDGNTSKKVLKYGTFMATMVQANSSDDVAAAIESAALPSGSARIKRETPFNISLNAYCGFFLGWEQIKGVDRPFCLAPDYHTFNSYGVTAPIGISISRGWRGWSFTAFGSIVDLGAITAFRFANDSAETVPKIELKDIISPGAFLSIGIPKTPLSVNMGYQVGPLLRKVNQAANTYQQNYSRVSISLCVDLPLLNFYSLPKKTD